MKIKLSTLFILFLIASKAFTQNLSFLNGFKYAIVTPLIYKDETRDAFGIESKAISSLHMIGLKCLDSENKNSWPEEALIEPCLIVLITITEGNLPNDWNCGSVKITFRNCKNEIIKDEIIKSKNAICSYPYRCCYYKWSDAVSSYFGRLQYTYNASLNKLKTDYQEIERTNDTEETIKAYLTNNNLDPIEGIYKSYQTEKLSYYKLGIIKKGNKYKAIIIETDLKNWQPGDVKSEFENSSMSGLYSVRWFMADKKPIDTFGMLENEGLLTIEFKNPQTREKTQDKFIKMFPSVSDISVAKSFSKSSGSGFFVSTTGLIATNAHVVDGASKIEASFVNEIGEFTYSAKIALIDKKNDVAILQVVDENFKGLSSIPFTIKENSEIGEKVFTIGFPLNSVMGTNFKVTDGIISSKSGISDDIRFYQISVPLQPGNSGGPLFDKSGNIIGITSAKLNSEAVGTQVENVNYAIKSTYLLSLYNMLPNAPNLPEFSQLENKEFSEQIKVLKNYVCLIKVY